MLEDRRGWIYKNFTSRLTLLGFFWNTMNQPQESLRHVSKQEICFVRRRVRAGTVRDADVCRDEFCSSQLGRRCRRRGGGNRAQFGGNMGDIGNLPATILGIEYPT